MKVQRKKTEARRAENEDIMNGYAKDTDRPELVAWRMRRMSEASARKPRNRSRYTRKGKTSWKGER